MSAAQSLYLEQDVEKAGVKAVKGEHRRSLSKQANEGQKAVLGAGSTVRARAEVRARMKGCLIVYL